MRFGAWDAWEGVLEDRSPHRRRHRTGFSSLPAALLGNTARWQDAASRRRTVRRPYPDGRAPEARGSPPPTPWEGAPADAVIALTDVYTGTGAFQSADDAKRKMREWVGVNDRFFPHAAQHDFEAWLLPFWSTIQRLAGHKMAAPSGSPETVNHNRPPSARIAEIFRAGACRDDYVKPRDAARILRENNLLVAAEACPELRAFLNTILGLCGGENL